MDVDEMGSGLMGSAFNVKGFIAAIGRISEQSIPIGIPL
jgi:hypothetical protein